MNVKVCAALVALALAVPAVSMAAVVDLNEIFASGEIAQGLETDKNFVGDQNGGDGNTQGGNIVVAGDMDKGIAQAADVDGKLKLTENGGNGNNQALNLIEGEVLHESAQGAVINDNVELAQNGGDGNLQGVNVVDGCATCD
jgi:hypothetical protein